MIIQNKTEYEQQIRNEIQCILEEVCAPRFKLYKDVQPLLSFCFRHFMPILVESQIDAEPLRPNFESNEAEVKFVVSDDTENLIRLSVDIAYHVHYTPEWKDIVTPEKFSQSLEDLMIENEFFYDLDFELREYLNELKEKWVVKNSLNFDIA